MLKHIKFAEINTVTVNFAHSLTHRLDQSRNCTGHSKSTRILHFQDILGYVNGLTNGRTQKQTHTYAYTPAHTHTRTHTHSHTRTC